MKAAFGVPWMGVVAMAHAHYRSFYDTLWHGLEPIARSSAFRDGCARMRLLAEVGVQELEPPPIEERLRRAGYADREIDEIRALLEVFSHGNYPYILLATLSRHLLAGGEFAGSESEIAADGAAGPLRPAGGSRLVLMEAHHADAPTRAIFEDIKATLALPVVNTDYRALARWPSYFALAWADLRPRIRTPAHAQLAGQLHDQALGIVRAFPNPAGLRADALRAAAARDACVEEVTGMVELFQWLLPELAVNVAFFRAQLA